MSSHSGHTGRSREHRSSPVGDYRTRLRRIVLGLLYLSALSLLILWEYRDHLEAISSQCELTDQVKSGLYNQPYTKLLNWAASDAAGHVVALAIPASLEEIQGNLCLGRAYLADVLRTLATQNPAIVVVDKYYSPGACASEPASTQDLIEAVRSLKVPVVIGESTNGTESKIATSCLLRKPQLEFDAPNVRHGLTRLNTEPERLPLTWLVVASADPPKVEFADSLSLAAVKAYDPAFAAQRNVRQLIRQDDHAYANLAIDIPAMTTTELFCSAGDESIRQRWSVTCSGQRVLPNLMGRIVVVGAEVSSDQKLVLDKRMWGFELQARYIETLLSGDYLRHLPISFGFVLFALYIFVIEGLPTILLACGRRWKKIVLLRHAYPQRRYFWVIFWTITVIVVSALASLALRYLPPLLVYGDILLVAVTRLIFFAAESAEHPFLHAHTHRKAHSMSTQNHDSETSHSSNDQGAGPSSKPGAGAPAPAAPAGSDSPAPVRMSRNIPGTEGGSQG